MFKRLSEKDCKMIAEYIERFGPSHEDLNVENIASLDYRLRFWDKAKSKYLGRMFGDNLILERKIEYEAPLGELVERYCRCSNIRCNSFYNELYSIILKRPEFNNLLNDYWDNPVNGHNSFYTYITSYDTLMSNRWEGPEVAIPLPNDKSFKVGPGTKIARILGRLAKEYDIPHWEEVRKAQANALTAKITKGTLCLSIHPMDYITMSDNSENWDSCMNWRETGAYRAGTVEMMNSPCIVVAYLKHPTHNYEGWNSKIWRELYIVTPEVITNIKGYPYENEWLTRYTVSWLKELAEAANVGRYEPGIKKYAEYEHEDDPWFKENNVSIHFRTNEMYNDCGRVNEFIYIGEGIHNEDIEINYSGERNCMCCGNNNHCDFDDADEVFCTDCDSMPVVYCHNCGTEIHIDSCTTGPDDEYYCDECFNELLVYPFDSSTCEFREDCYKFIVKLPDGNFNAYDVSYASDPQYFITTYCQGINNWDELVYNEDYDAHVIPYDCLGDKLKRYFYTYYSISKWDNYGKPEEEIQKALNKMDSETLYW